MDNKDGGKKVVKPIVPKKNRLEEELKKDSTTQALVKAIKGLLNKDR